MNQERIVVKVTVARYCNVTFYYISFGPSLYYIIFKLSLDSCINLDLYIQSCNLKDMNSSDANMLIS